MQWIHQYEHPMITVTMKFFSFIGSTSSVVVISLVFLAILYKAFHQRHELFLFSFVLIGTVIFNILLKIYFQRERPSLYTFIVEEGFSFPSGHSMAALSLYGIIGFLLWRHITKHRYRVILCMVIAAFILLIGMSRIYLGVHYPSDVIGAYLFSGFWLTISIWLYKFRVLKTI